jgi:hypothetical protein
MASSHLEYAMKWIHQAFTLVSERYPKGLKYEGVVRCTPEEQFNVLTRRSGSDRTFDIARTDQYLIAVKHSFNDAPLTTRYLSLPYAGPGGLTTIASSRLYFKPVLTDPIISVNVENIFARFNKIKLTFNRKLYYFCSNAGKFPREAVLMCWSHIFNSKLNKARDSVTSPKTSLAAYLFAKYGVTEVFRRFAQTDVVVGVAENTIDILGKTRGTELNIINEELYPKETWVICSTAGMKKRRIRDHQITPLKIAIRKEHYNSFTRTLICGFFYTIDHFSDHAIQFQYDTTATWRLLLGYILRGPESAVGRLVSEMEEHISSIDTYLDRFVANDLKKLGYKCEDFYEFLVLILKNFEKWILEKDTRGNSTIGKQFSVLPYLLYDVVAAINNASFALGSPSNVRTAKEYDTVFGEYLRHTMIYDLTRGGHGEVDTAVIAGDCYALKTTMDVCPQTHSSGRRPNAAPGVDPDAVLHASWALVYQLQVTSKACPSGINRVNGYTPLDENFAVFPSKERKALIDWSQAYITRK